MVEPVPFAGEYPGGGRVPAVGFAGFSFGSIRPTDVPRLPVYVSRSRLTVRMGFHGTRMRSCGVCRRGSGGTFALGRTAWGASRCAAGVRDCCEPKRKKMRGEHEGIRIGPLTGHMGRGRTSMTNTRQAKARRRFRNRRFRYVTRAAGRGQRRRNGGNLEGTDNRKEPKQNPGNRMIPTVSGVPIRAENTRFELVRLLHQHAFQACAIDH